jgi:hypothetical protein
MRGDEVMHITIIGFCPYFETHHLVRPSHLWDITLCMLVAVCRYFVTAYRFNLQASSINPENETDRLSLNIGKQVSTYAA